MTCHCYNLKVWALAQSLGDDCSLVILKRVLSKYKEDLIFLLPHLLQVFCLKFLVNVSHTCVIDLAITNAYFSQ